MASFCISKRILTGFKKHFQNLHLLIWPEREVMMKSPDEMILTKLSSYHPYLTNGLFHPYQFDEYIQAASRENLSSRFQPGQTQTRLSFFLSLSLSLSLCMSP